MQFPKGNFLSLDVRFFPKGIFQIVNFPRLFYQVATTLDISIINVFIKFTKKVGETTFLSIQTIKCKDRIENCSDNKERKRKTWITTINKKDTPGFPGYWIGLNSVILFCLEYPTSDPGSQMQQKRRRQHVVSFISINKGYKLLFTVGVSWLY